MAAHDLSLIVSKAIARLKMLHELAGELATAQVNAHRWYLLGATHKIEAGVLAASGKNWGQIKHALLAAHQAFQKGEGTLNSPSFNPQSMVCRLQLDALLGTPAADLASCVENCQSVARERFAAHFRFDDGILTAHAALAYWLAGPDDTLQATVDLATRYQTEVAKLEPDLAQFDAVVNDISLLGELYAHRAKSDAQKSADALRVEALRTLAQQLKSHSQAPDTQTAPLAPTQTRKRSRRTPKAG